MRRPSPERLASLAALFIAGLLTAVSIAQGGFVPGGTDSSAYVAAGDQWRRGDLFRAKAVSLWAAWPNAIESTVPVGYRPGVVSGTEVPIYPPGFPLMIAAAASIVGPLGGYLVAPVMGGVLVWCAFALARELAGNLAGVLAAALVASSPVTLLHTVHPMSDVPAAACWGLAWWWSLSGTRVAAGAAGLAVSMAILVRPNLAPLALVIGLLILAGGTSQLSAVRERRWQSAAVFVATAAIGPIVLAWTQAALYGGVLTSSYGDWQALFDIAYVAPNLRMYPRLLAQTHTLLPLVGLLVVPLAVGWRGVFPDEARVVAISAGAIIVVNLGLYLPYMSFDHWPFLRFLLPALTALFVLFAAVVAFLTRACWARARWAAPAVPLMAVIVMAQGRDLSAYALNDWYAQARIRLMGSYLREALPENAVVMSFVHSGAIAQLTGREVVRLDLLEPGTLDRVVDDLRRHGYRPVFVLDEALEASPFQQRFAGSRYGQLDWAPRAVFATVTRILYFDPDDLAGARNGEAWPIDTLR